MFSFVVLQQVYRSDRFFLLHRTVISRFSTDEYASGQALHATAADTKEFIGNDIALHPSPHLRLSCCFFSRLIISVAAANHIHTGCCKPIERRGRHLLFTLMMAIITVAWPWCRFQWNIYGSRDPRAFGAASAFCFIFWRRKNRTGKKIKSDQSRPWKRRRESISGIRSMKLMIIKYWIHWKIHIQVRPRRKHIRLLKLKSSRTI